jgi:hypothetical protein
MNRLIVLFTVIVLATTCSTVFATRYMTPEELAAQQASIQEARPQPAPSTSQPFMPVYKEFIQRTADFLAHKMQDSLSSDPSYGGMREAENQMTTIETDNTLEAIWFWSRYYQLFGVDAYHQNIDRAWIYVNKNPAWREEGGAYNYYRDFNCGLTLFAESKYREVYGDTAYLHMCTDSCIPYLFSHPLSFTQSGYEYLNPFTTGYCAGMLYRYWNDRGVQAYHDTAVARGTLVKNWIQAGAQARLQYNVWAMSGGTALWGVCNSVLQEDTIAAKAWLAIYVDSMNFFQPSGSWNNSWNIYRAWAYRAAWDIGHVGQWQTNHKRLVDTLMAQDQDLDGGIMETWNNPQNTDGSWTSTYLDFMGMDYLFDPSQVELGTPGRKNLDFTLQEPFPNPAKGAVSIRYTLSRPGEVRLNLYNLAGEKVAILIEGSQGAGFHQVNWTAPKGLGSGIYFLRLTARQGSLTRKVVLAR